MIENMRKSSIKSIAPIKFYLSIVLFLSINFISYVGMILFIVRGDYGNLGNNGFWIYLLSMVLVPISAYRTLKSAKIESDLSLRFWGFTTPFLVIVAFMATGVKAVPILMLVITNYVWGMIPISWYNFREKRWEEK